MLDTQIRLPSYGRIKTGCLGEERVSKSGKKYRIPVSWDHFKITTNERGEDGNFKINWPMTKRIASEGQNPKEPKRIGPVTFPVDTIEGNFFTNYAWYTKSGLKCMGDGTTCDRITEDGSRETLECDPHNCPHRAEKNCKPMGVLNVIPVCMEETGGVYLYRTHSMTSITTIMTQLKMYESASIDALGRVKFSGVPYHLTARSTEVITEGGERKKITFASIDFIEGNLSDYKDYLKKNFKRRINLEDGSVIDMDTIKRIMEDPEDFYISPPKEDDSAVDQKEAEGKQSDTKQKSRTEDNPDPPKEKENREEILSDFDEWFGICSNKFSRSGTKKSLRKIGIDMDSNTIYDYPSEKIQEAVDKMKKAIVVDEKRIEDKDRDFFEERLEKKLWSYALSKAPQAGEDHHKNIIIKDILSSALGMKKSIIGKFPECLSEMTMMKLKEIDEQLKEVQIKQD